MRRAAEILTTLVLFAIVMAAIGWAARDGVERVFPWLLAHLGISWIWIALIAIWVAAVLYAWRGHRPKAGKAGNAAGR